MRKEDHMDNLFLETIDWQQGQILYNDFDIDFSRPFQEQVFSFKEDLLQVRYGDYLLDLGWYPEFDEQGRFVVRVIRNVDWQRELFTHCATDAESLKNGLKMAIAYCISR